MNYTLTNLILTNFFQNSPFIAEPIIKIPSLVIFQCYFAKTFSHIIYSQSLGKFQISSSYFSSSLRSSVMINSDVSYQNQKITKNIYYFNCAVSFFSCTFIKCFSSTFGGAIYCKYIAVQLTDCIFRDNSAQIGGALQLLQVSKSLFERNIFEHNSAEYNAAVAFEFQDDVNFTIIRNINISKNSAKNWNGGLRIDFVGGEFSGLFLSNNNAFACSGFFDYSFLPKNKTIKFSFFGNNSSHEKGAGVTIFHMCHLSTYQSCVFIENKCETAPNSLSIETISCIINIINCYFDEEKESAIGMKYSDNQIILNNSEFSLKGSSFFQEAINSIQNIIIPPQI